MAIEKKIENSTKNEVQAFLFFYLFFFSKTKTARDMFFKTDIAAHVFKHRCLTYLQVVVVKCSCYLQRQHQ